MKNIDDVLKQKETELVQRRKEVEALRLAVRLLSEGDEAAAAAAIASGHSAPAPTLVKATDKVNVVSYMQT